jgi:hypothetical protein
MEEIIDLNKKPEFFPLPYPLMVQSETQVRDTQEFWRFRTITNVLRQSPDQVKKFKERYNDKSL